MAVSDENVRVMITLPKPLKEQLELEAKEDNRSLSNYILMKLQTRKNTNKE